MQDAESLVSEKKVSFWIFPEGTRSREGPMGPFKKGAFHLAVGTGLPLVPVAISSYYKKLNLWRWRSGTILVECLEPIPTRGLGGDAVEELLRGPMV